MFVFFITSHRWQLGGGLVFELSVGGQSVIGVSMRACHAFPPSIASLACLSLISIVLYLSLTGASSRYFSRWLFAEICHCVRCCITAVLGLKWQLVFNQDLWVTQLCNELRGWWSKLANFWERKTVKKPLKWGSWFLIVSCAASFRCECVKRSLRYL